MPPLFHLLSLPHVCCFCFVWIVLKTTQLLPKSKNKGSIRYWMHSVFQVCVKAFNIAYHVHKLVNDLFGILGGICPICFQVPDHPTWNCQCKIIPTRILLCPVITRQATMCPSIIKIQRADSSLIWYALYKTTVPIQSPLTNIFICMLFHQSLRIKSVEP